MRVRNTPIPHLRSAANDWVADYPNPADFAFDYYKLLDLARSTGSIGKAPKSGIQVAIVGAGAAGMTAARELFRCGYNVTIYEASDRICGRHYTLPVPGQTTGMELGAMRFPFFAQPGAQNSLFEYYLLTEANSAVLSPFPNPGSAPDNTGVYMNGGLGPGGEFKTPTMIIWPPNTTIPDAQLAAVAKLVDTFIAFFTSTVSPKYGTSEWASVWEQIADRYDRMSFSDLVFASPVTVYQNDGWLGGFGLNDAQSELFYTIGSGDGSWGAFYEVAAMWFIRCVMFGFNSNLQTVAGLSNPGSRPYFGQSVHSSNARLQSPAYTGIQSLVEWLYYAPAPGQSQSLYDVINDGPVNTSVVLLTSTTVQAITKAGSQVQVTASDGTTKTFDHVIVTPNIWASQMQTVLQNFDIHNDLPIETTTARNEQHLITSNKVFFPLTQCYWENPQIGIPQVIITDTFVQDAYGVKWGANDAGALLASYTWEDDATKLEPMSDAELAAAVLAELDQICNDTIGSKVSPYVMADNAVVFRWADQVGYNGCAKLYRQRSWAQSYSLLAYNQQYSASSHLYFAGESYSVEGGWTEPALRLAIDAVIRLMQNTGATFSSGFFPGNDYPNFDVDFQPDESYPEPPVAEDRETRRARRKARRLNRGSGHEP
jgi:tryptophan 2-monooxygenase